VRTRSRAPVSIAGILAFPLYFAMLMGATLALEDPVIHEWTNGGASTTVPKGALITVYGEPTGLNEATIWLAALVPAALLVLVGYIANRVPPVGVYAPCALAIALAVTLNIRVEHWEQGHTERYPVGADLIPEGSSSNVLLPGEYEQKAREAAESLASWTIALAVVFATIFVLLAVRRRREEAREAVA
jgi:preprotein translocase subunit SecG